jgi:ABC-type Fe3+/spermidine/putrescine transport system ATPase subunit
MIGLRIEGLNKKYGDNPALSNVTFAVEDGELFFLLGPSGCGKTTLLRIIAGFCTPDSGNVIFHGDDLLSKPPEKRNVGMVFQNYSLWPHMTVFDNVGYGLKIRKAEKQTIQNKVTNALVMVDMEGYDDRLPGSLSGGEQQRIALARALVYEPEILLLDEPLSNLDAKLRREMRSEIRNIHEELGITMIYVTHDQEEAVTLADRIALFRKSSIEQIDTPENLYAFPSSIYSAEFFGVSNCIECHVGEVLPDAIVASFGDYSLIVAVDKEKRIHYPVGTPLRLVIRPENIRIIPEKGTENTITGRIVEEEYQGGITTFTVKAGENLLKVMGFFNTGGNEPLKKDDIVILAVNRRRIHVLGGRP